MGWGKRLLFWAALPQQRPGTHERGNGPGQGQDNTRFLSCSPQFLRASLEPIEDQTWTVGLSQELSQQLGSSAPRSWEKVCLLSCARAGAGAGALLTQAFSTASPSSPQKALLPGLPQRLATAWHCGRPRLLPGTVGCVWGQPSPDRSSCDHISGSGSSLSAFPVQGSGDGAGSLSGPQTCPRAGAEVPPGDKPCGAV